jgi:hypothetical protein
MVPSMPYHLLSKDHAVVGDWTNALNNQFNLLNFKHMFTFIHQREREDRWKWMKDFFSRGKLFS